MLLQTLLAVSFAIHSSVAKQLSSEQPRYSVRGTVVNSATGEPIRRALVQIYVDRERSQLTGADGQFTFEGIPAGSIGFRVQKPGYYSPQETMMGPMELSSIMVGPDAPAVILKLIPEGVIYGRISGDGGEPLENLPVHVFVDRVENGKRSRAVWRTAKTNEEGLFRLPELLPGKYFVFVGPSLLPASFVKRGQESGADGYAGQFFPRASDLSSATPIEVAAGKQVELNIALQTQPFYRISGTVSGCPTADTVGLQFFNAGGQPIPAGFEFNRERGTFRSPWLPTGRITIMGFCHDQSRQQAYSGSQTLDIGSDRAGVHLILAPNATIPVNMRLEKTRNEPVQQSQFVTEAEGPLRRMEDHSPARVVLSPVDDGVFARGQYGSEPIGPRENPWVGVRNVPPGTYSVEILPNGQYYVQSARLGSLNLLEDNLRVEGSGSLESIEIVLRDDVASLTGTVSVDGQRVAASVLAIPVSNPGRIQFTGAGPDGQFQFPNLAPGSYRLLATDQVQGWEYNNPEVLRKYLSGAREVSVGPDQSGKVDLELVRVGEQGR